MNYTYSIGAHSNIEISIICTPEDTLKLKNDALIWFQKEIDMAWFRKGHVPLAMVEKQVRSEYLTMSVVEEAVNQILRKIIKEKPDLALIGEPYDLNIGDMKTLEDAIVNGMNLTLKLDLYPEVIEENNNRKILSIDTVESEPTEDEIEKSYYQLRKQYASYDEQETIDPNSIVKIKLSYQENGEQISTSSLFVWSEEYIEHKWLLDIIVWKHVAETISIPYNKKTIELLVLKDETKKPDTIILTIDKVYSMSLPEMTPEKIQELFGNETTVTDETWLKAEIKKTITEQKLEYNLQSQIDIFLEKAKESLKVVIPATLKSKELESRIEKLKEKMWWDKRYQDYLTKIWTEEEHKMIDELKQATSISLEKFFLFKKITELLNITTIDRDKPMDAEKKVYEILKK